MAIFEMYFFIRSYFANNYSYSCRVILNCRFIFTGLLPFLYLSVMNLLIFNRLRRNQNSRVRRRSSEVKSTSTLATILIVVGNISDIVSNRLTMPCSAGVLDHQYPKDHPKLGRNCHLHLFR